MPLTQKYFGPMEKFIDLLSGIPPYIIVTYVAVFLTLESFWPDARNQRNKLKHLLNNSGLLLIATAINFFISYVLINWVLYVDQNRIGLMNLVSLPAVIIAFAGVVFIDLGSYFTHRILHKFKFFWRFHRVHHSEMDMDCSTSFKFHPIEPLIVLPFQLAVIGVVGISFSAIVIYNAIILPVLFIQHSNINYPMWIERFFSPVFSTPAFHRVHHSDEQKYTDSNYGDIFCIWDRIFGTFQTTTPNNLQYGLKEFADRKSQTFWSMIITPFKK
jgi:sterol desaturase/sphingolipid hydroxylase (fatty acid hydroxylase superfamily)